ncbi:MAG: hypothetical protein IT317_24735 [Anaerolineales bacterium]|nr:hypothetical protein [Anaerolineales bacterium]
MSIRITNNSVSAVVRSYAIAPLAEGDTIVWLELAPQHPKVIGAIWASLVNGTREFLRLRDDDSDQTYTARGLNHRYIRKTMDAPRIAGRARPKFMRLVAPAMVKLDAATFGKKPFFAGAWRWDDSQGVSQQLAPATALAAMLEQGTHLPIRIGWGPYLLAEALAQEYAVPLVTGGPAPEGYAIQPDTPWADIIAEGVKRGHISLNGDCQASIAVAPLPILTAIHA